MIRNVKGRCFLSLLFMAMLGGLLPRAGAQSAVDPRAFVQITLPGDSPLELVSVDYGSSRITRNERGMKMDLDLVLSLRNRSAKPIEGLALALGYGFGKPGTEGLDAVSGIRLEPGQSYPLAARMRAEIELPPARSRARPVDLPTALRVRLDAVLFSDGTSYGSDQMRSLAAMRVNQAESARDRRFFLALFQSGGLPRLLPVLEKWVNEANALPGAQRVLAGEAAERARARAQRGDFRVVRFPGAPLEIVSARAGVYDGGLVDPSLEVRNHANTPIADFQVAWVLRDVAGNEFRSATISASARSSSAHGFPLPAGQVLSWSNPAVLEVGPGAANPALAGRVYVRAVQFVNGQIWVPERVAIEATDLSRAAATSPETFRLLGLYRGQGPGALLGEFRR